MQFQFKDAKSPYALKNDSMRKVKGFLEEKNKNKNKNICSPNLPTLLIICIKCEKCQIYQMDNVMATFCSHL